MFQPWASRVSGKVFLITGASSGLGEALARQIAHLGGKCALLARRLDRLEALATELSSKYRVPLDHFLVCKVDVGDEAGMKDVFSRVVSHFGGVDYVIANAGFGVGGLLSDLTTEDLKRQWDTNVWGVVHTAYAALEPLKKSQGVLALVGSVMGYLTTPTAIPYSMSKYAVRSLAEGLYVEWSPFGIGVTLVSPGFLETEIRKVDNQGKFEASRKDPVPKILMEDSEKAAIRVLRAIVKRRREVVFPLHAKFGLLFAGALRGLLYLSLRLLQNRTAQ
jgi:NAD(P)-dependent dehydrogenase (short-subunit alcohol dehydrogenase family)